MSYLSKIDTDFGFIDVETTEQVGLELRDAYQASEPYPHTVIDNFLPEKVLNQCVRAFPKCEDPDSEQYARAQERLKTSYNPDYLSPKLRSLFYSLGSRPFLQFLENLTGIEGLIADPYFAGGGFHRIGQGGHLSVHADFNYHKKLNLERRINILIYLNKNWKPEYGGQLELWDDDMKSCEVSVVPEFNRCVIFNTTSTSMHGNPEPIKHPKSTPRRSIALYYYTATWDGTRREHTTQFHKRPGSHDKVDWKIRSSEMMQDFLPPILDRNMRRVGRKLGL